jgi:hypothetical protein
VDLDPRLGSRQGFSIGRIVQHLPNVAAVAYPIAENGVNNVWVEPVNGSPGHQVTHFTSEVISDFHWSPDRKTLAVLREHDVADVVLVREENP